MDSILVGTADGVFRCEKRGKSWSIGRPQLHGNEVPCIAIRPDDRHIVYAATRFGGLFKSTDGGNHWAIEFDPDDPQSVVIATGGEGARYVKLDKSEVYLSVNRGEQWKEIIGGLPNIGSLAPQ